MYFTRILNAWALLFIQTLLLFLYPSMLNIFLNYLTTKTAPSWLGYILCFGFLATNTLSFIPYYYGTYILFTLCTSIRGALTAAVYRKSLKLVPRLRSSYSKGQLMNLLVVDIENIIASINFLHLVPLSCLKLAIILYQLKGEMSYLSLIPLASVFIWSVLLFIIYAVCIRSEKIILRLMDRRIALMEQILDNLNILRYLNWQVAFEKLVAALRLKEVNQIFNANGLYTAIIVTMYSCGGFLAILSLSTCIYLNMDANLVLNPTRIFVIVTTVSLFVDPICQTLFAFYRYGQAIISIQRLVKFLTMSSEAADQPLLLNEFAVTIDWKKGYKSKLFLPVGQLVAVVGKHKNSFFLSCLQEDSFWSDKMSVSGSQAYASEAVWFHHQSIRNNIIFAGVVNEIWYQKVLDICDLSPMLVSLPEKDNTVIELQDGRYNLNIDLLQLVSLARAVYHSSEVYLLDDPLSKLDSEKADQIFDRVISNEGLLKDSTRLVGVSNLHLLPRFESVLVLGDHTHDDSVRGGENRYPRRNLERDTYTESVQSTCLAIPPFVAPLSEMQIMDFPSNDNHCYVEMESDTTKKLPSYCAHSEFDQDGPSFQSTQVLLETTSVSSLSVSDFRDFLPASALNSAMQEEATKSVSWHTYWQYIRSLNPLLLTLLTSVLIAVFIVSKFSYWELKWLSEDGDFIYFGQMLANQSLPPDTRQAFLYKLRQTCRPYLIIYGHCVLAIFLAIFFHLLLFTRCLWRSSLSLHSASIKQVLKGTVSFSKYSLLNRFSTDFLKVDRSLGLDFHSCVAQLISFVTSCVVFMLSLSPFYVGFGVIVPLLLIALPLLRIYLPCCRQAQRLYFSTRTPILTTFSETGCSDLGTRILRIYQRRSQFANVFDRLINENAACLYLLYTSKCWFYLRIECLCGFVLFFVSLIIVMIRESVSIGTASLLITFSLGIGDSLSGLIRNLPDLVSDIVSMERVEDFFRHQSDEQEPENESLTPLVIPAGQFAQLDFVNFSAYTEDGLDLIQQINLIAGGTHPRISVLTAASLNQRKFIIDFILGTPTPCSSSIFSQGSITLNGIDIARLQKPFVALLPQKNMFFQSFSIRMNLDPLHNLSDEDLWSALDNLGLKPWIESLQLNLDSVLPWSLMTPVQERLLSLGRILTQQVHNGIPFRLVILEEPCNGLDDAASSQFIDLILNNIFPHSTLLIFANKPDFVQSYFDTVSHALN
ncbi:Canalicular multispecific organic anion transporter 1 [Cichlidogyrus casuarinus]|uniref:Canalicular multispecific organic anion transporter 1 n=1 Tax=Cichlidogyrus casuarinus TaxID=1844966 RepID=A0ABD2QCI9_9PLAT